MPAAMIASAPDATSRKQPLQRVMLLLLVAIAGTLLMFFIRQSAYCPALNCSAEQLIALAKLPTALRPPTFESHDRVTIDRYITHAGAFAEDSLARGRPPLLKNPSRSGPLLYDYLLRQQEAGATWPMLALIRTAVDAWYTARDLPIPQCRDLSAFCRKLRKEHPVTRATPATPEQIKMAIKHAVDIHKPRRAARDRAILALPFVTAMRPSESRHLRVEDTKPIFEGRGLHIDIPQSKVGPREVEITQGRDPLFDPLRALEDWLKIADITEGIVFRAIDRYDNVGDDEPLSYNALRAIIDPYFAFAGITGKVTGYTTRRGWATSAKASGARDSDIQEHLGHKRMQTTRIYIAKTSIPFHRSITGVLLS